MDKHVAKIERKAITHEIPALWSLLGFAVGLLCDGLLFVFWLILFPAQEQQFLFYFKSWILSLWPSKYPSLAKIHYLSLAYGNPHHWLDPYLAHYQIKVLPYPSIFHGFHPLYFVAFPVMVVFFAAMLGGLWGVVKKHELLDSLRDYPGLWWRGSRQITIDEYNKEVNGDGVRYLLEE